MDGWVIVGTKLDSKQLEKDLKGAERRLQQYEKEAEKLTKAKAKAEVDLAPYKEQKKLIEEMTNESLQYAQTQKEVENILGTEKIQLEELNTKYSKQIANLEEVNKKIKENAKNQGLVTTQIQETNTKLQQTKGYENVNNALENINKKTTGVIRKVGRWALAVFGVRAIYGFIRNSVSTLSQYNEKLATDLEYIRFSIAKALQPLIEGLISLVYKLLTYVNYIAQAWFGVNLFANASAEAMSRGASSAEKMKKSLAGFDEMNVLNENGSVGALGGLPSYDLSKMQDVKIPKWLEWIAKNGSKVATILGSIAGAIVALKLGNFAKELGLVNTQFTIMQGLGIFATIYGIISLIQDLIDYYKKLDTALENNGTSWNDFGKIVTDVGIIVAGLGLVFLGLPATITGAIIGIVGIITRYWSDIQKFFDNNVFGWFDRKIAEMQKRGVLGKALAEVLTEIKRIAKDGVDAFGVLLGGFKGIFDGIIAITKGDFKNGLKTAMKGVANAIIGVLNTLINSINTILAPIRSIIVALGKIGGKSWSMNTVKIPTIPKLAVGGVVNMPGRGINYGGANIGENGAEGVIPLTNSQMMAQLGEAIGKYVNINATVPVYVGNRQIAREIKKISADSDFAFNR